MKCVAGCINYYGGEIYHHKDCPYYEDSFSKRWDKLKSENVLTDEQLEIKFSELCKTNWKIEKMADSLNVTGAKNIIDNWHKASRQQLLSMLNIKEDENYKFVYHEIN